MNFLLGLMAFGGIFQAGQQIIAAGKESTEAKYNAKIKEQQAKMIEAQKGLEAYQFDRAMGKAGGTLRANVGASGITMSGSPMAAWIDMETQMELDKAIGQYNLEYQKRFALSEAGGYYRQASNIKAAGYSNAFSTLLNTGVNYGIASGWGTKK